MLLNLTPSVQSKVANYLDDRLDDDDAPLNTKRRIFYQIPKRRVRVTQSFVPVSNNSRFLPPSYSGVANIDSIPRQRNNLVGRSLVPVAQQTGRSLIPVASGVQLELPIKNLDLDVFEGLGEDDGYDRFGIKEDESVLNLVGEELDQAVARNVVLEDRRKAAEKIEDRASLKSEENRNAYLSERNDRYKQLKGGVAINKGNDKGNDDGYFYLDDGNIDLTKITNKKGQDFALEYNAGNLLESKNDPELADMITEFNRDLKEGLADFDESVEFGITQLKLKNKKERLSVANKGWGEEGKKESLRAFDKKSKEDLDKTIKKAQGERQKIIRDLSKARNELIKNRSTTLINEPTISRSNSAPKSSSAPKSAGRSRKKQLPSADITPNTTNTIAPAIINKSGFGPKIIKSPEQQAEEKRLLNLTEDEVLELSSADSDKRTDLQGEEFAAKTRLKANEQETAAEDDDEARMFSDTVIDSDIKLDKDFDDIIDESRRLGDESKGFFGNLVGSARGTSSAIQDGKSNNLHVYFKIYDQKSGVLLHDAPQGEHSTNLLNGLRIKELTMYDANIVPRVTKSGNIQDTVVIVPYFVPKERYDDYNKDELQKKADQGDSYKKPSFSTINLPPKKGQSKLDAASEALSERGIQTFQTEDDELTTRAAILEAPVLLEEESEEEESEEEKIPKQEKTTVKKAKKAKAKK
jgi:hypothetical protein